MIRWVARPRSIDDYTFSKMTTERCRPPAEDLCLRGDVSEAEFLRKMVHARGPVLYGLYVTAIMKKVDLGLFEMGLAGEMIECAQHAGRRPS